MTTQDYLLEKFGVVTTTKNAAEVLHCHESHVRSMCQRGELPAVKIGDRWRIPTARLAAYLDGE